MHKLFGIIDPEHPAFRRAEAMHKLAESTPMGRILRSMKELQDQQKENRQLLNQVVDGLPTTRR